ncbi:HAD-IIB family hydrolase [Bacillus sp. CHD6a]|uniref:HAD-IIB family hydrolase n=1 Tax=Bacillus sp. CHD6a TaxID=1643452 RepID=UPI0006CCAB75|nr:HAD-IIB family hydrolase [Bacillus sp. CHD6a]KPB03426.1 haloacid dehalogenase [Bacillus sp. CHD6a]
MSQGVFTFTNETDFLLFLDFDETYFPHECNEEQRIMLKELEAYLNRVSLTYRIKVGWVTGSSLQQVQDKVRKANLHYFPHFISSNLGTEIWEIDQKRNVKPVSQWDDHISHSGFSHQLVEDILIELKNVYGIKLYPQTQLGQQEYKMNYYYYKTSHAIVEYHLAIIKRLACNSGISVNINRCNPKAGDPENAYDIDFIPKGTGKKAVVQFMRHYYQVPFERTLAFGDSGNDIDMLKAVKHGYLLKNATDEARKLHRFITNKEYGEGVMEICKTIFKEDTVSK